jgi:hypothetical protein
MPMLKQHLANSGSGQAAIEPIAVVQLLSLAGYDRQRQNDNVSPNKHSDFARI